MGICSDALYSDLCEDLSFCLSTDEQSAKDIWPDATVKQFASHALLRSFYKKLVEQKAEEADERALDKFLAVNEKCRTWKLHLDNSWSEVLLGELKRALYNFWNRDGFPLVTLPDEVLDYARTGPGSSIMANGDDFYTKLFSSRLSCTNLSLYSSYSRYVERMPLWDDAEKQRLSHYGGPHVVKGSRLSFAPKTVDISRLICVEPSLNMFFQLGLGTVLERRLREVFSISLGDQPNFNRELARLGSIDGSFDTIDLSSASDSLSIGMLEEVLPPSMMGWLRKLRSPEVETSRGQVELNMISTMGNGFTFPLQTILFSCVVSACMTARSRKLRRNKRSQDGRIGHAVPGNFGVFGDDIICEKQITRDVLHLLGLLGFTVNTEKTFVEGPFRESCGYDYYKGHNVRGIYAKSISSQQDRYALINKLNEWTAQTGISLSRTIQHLRRSVKYLPVPLHENADAGIRLPLSLLTQKNLNGNRSIVYRAWASRDKCLRVEDDRIDVPRGSKRRIYNPSGLLLSFLDGRIRKRGKIDLRLEVALYTAKRKVTPSWDDDPAKRDSAGGMMLPALSNSLPLSDAIYLNWVD